MESKNKGLITDKTLVHVISIKKTGSYITRGVRVLGTITPEKLEEINKDKKENRKLNEIVSYTCVYEYSFKGGVKEEKDMWYKCFYDHLDEEASELSQKVSKFKM